MTRRTSPSPVAQARLEALADSGAAPMQQTLAPESSGLCRGLIQVASAGTGKTFALSGRYLQLLFSGAHPAAILATTFTRAAAGEILDRIVSRLTVAAANDGSAAELGAQLGLAVDRARAMAVLDGLMKSLHQLQVGTIDSFFHGVARAASLDLGLPPGWELLDPDQVFAGMDIAVQGVLAGGSADPLLALLSQTDANRRISSAFHDLVGELYGLWLEALPSAWQIDPPRGDLPDEARRAGWIAILEAEAAQAGAQLAKALGRDRDAVVNGNWEALAESTLVGNVARGDCRYSRKDLSAPLVDVLRQMGDAVSVAALRLLRQRNESAAGLLEAFAERYQAWQQEHGSLGFEDLGRILRPLAGAGATALQARLRHEARHLLLDEFQDTSPGQWQVLDPLARAAVERPDGGSFYCVGDPKQSIYSWRGGEAGMFQVVRRALAGQVADAPGLVRSWRSAPPVIEAVNDVFLNLRDAATKGPADRAAVEEWAAGFEKHETVHEGLSGCARLVQAEPGGDDSLTEPARHRAGIEDATIAAVQRLAGQPGLTVGLLVRAHKDAAPLIFRLRQLGIACSEEGGSHLTDSAACNVLLAAVRLADHPGDSVAGFLVAHSPLGAILGLPTMTGPADGAFVAACHRVAAELRGRLYADGYGRTLFGLARPLFDQATSRERGRLELLVNLADEFDLDWSPRPGVFVERASAVRVPDPSAAAVRVMTIHKAKGLEFDAVVAPLFGSTAAWAPGHKPAIVYSRDDATRRINRILRSLPEKQRQFLPEDLQAVHAWHEKNMVREVLCVLYVAMTRAIRDLTLVVGPKAAADQTSAEGLLLRTLGHRGAADGGTLYRKGSESWLLAESRALDRRPGGAVAPAANASTTVIHLRAGSSAGRSSPWLAPSANQASRPFSRPLQRNAGEPGENRAAARLRGTVLHRFLEQVSWLTGFNADTQLQSIAASAGLDPVEAHQLIQHFHERLKLPQIRQWLDQPRYLDHVREHVLPPSRTLLEALSVEVLNECRLVAALDEGQVEAVIDRLCLIREGQRLIAAELVDFKTDAVPAEAVPARARSYAPQLDLYRRAVSESFRLPVAAVFAQLVFVEPGVAVLAPPAVANPVARAGSG